MRAFGYGGLVDDLQGRRECQKAHRQIHHSHHGLSSPFNQYYPERGSRSLRIPSSAVNEYSSNIGDFCGPMPIVNGPRHPPWFDQFGRHTCRHPSPWEWPPPFQHPARLPGPLGVYRGGGGRPRFPRPPFPRRPRPGGRRQRRLRFDDDHLYDDTFSEDDFDELESLLGDSEFSDDSGETPFSDSSPRSFVRRNPWRHRERGRGGLFGDEGLGGRGRRRRSGLGGMELGGLGGRELARFGGLDRVPGRFERDRHRTGQFGRSSFDTLDSGFSDGDTW